MFCEFGPRLPTLLPVPVAVLTRKPS